jgi:Zn-dependent M28 family amino/carboxypeptidase
LARLFQSSSYPPYKYRVKFCWWGAEEVGIVGSDYHVSQANQSIIEGERLSDYLVNFNYDMLGSPNFQMGIYDGNSANFSTTPPKAIPGSIRLTQLFRDWFISQNLPYNIIELGGASDYASFLAAGIVISGLNAGIDDIKTKEERDYYDRMLGQGKGGIAGVVHDPCYHDSCDSLANINPLGYHKLSQGAAYVLEYLGRHSDLRSYLYPQAEIHQLERSLLHKSTQKYNAQREFYKKIDL